MYYNSLDNVNFDEDVDTIPQSSTEMNRLQQQVQAAAAQEQNAAPTRSVPTASRTSETVSKYSNAQIANTAQHLLWLAFE